MVRITPLDARDDDRFAAWYAALRAGASAGRHAPLVVAATALRTQLLDQTRAVRHAVGAFDGDMCLGTGVLERDTEQNTHLGEVDVNVPPAYRRCGIGTRLLAALADEAASAGLTTLVGEVTVVGKEAPGLCFAEGAGFASVHTEDRLVLDLPLDDERLDALTLTSTGPRYGYTVTSWAGPTPAEHLPTMARLRTGMNAEVPTGDLDADPELVTPESLAAGDRRLEARGYLSLVSLVTAPDGSPAGYSHLLAQRDDPAHALQDDTYVLGRHRGHRLGSWLKVTNLRALQAALPAARHLHTWTDETNGAMHAVNLWFGFRVVEVMHAVQRGGRAGD